jgi:RNA exonuclease 1
MSNKKYKLFAAPADGRKAPCAFFVTAAGCRHGDSCKFSHELNASDDINKVTEHGSVVSSESEPEITTGKSKQSDDKDDPFAPPGSKGGEDSAAKKKNRRGKRSEDDLPFANPKKKVKVETTINPSSTPSNNKQKKVPKTPVEATTPPFLNLNLPIASFSVPTAKNTSSKKDEPKVSSNEEKVVTGTQKKKNETDGFILPKSNPAAKKWINAIQTTQSSKAFAINYNFAKYKQKDEESGICSANGWVKAKPYGSWCEKLPQVIAIDCEMCETQDPVSGDKNFNALCRISIVDAVTKEVLLDSLCKPAWPVSNHRSWVNGITEEHLENVQFTVRHAQAFLMALCSEETVIVGHAVHNDLAAVRMEHYCVVDSALLFKATDSETATVSLKDSAKSILGKDMPDTHDSVNDALTALECLEYYLQKGSDMKTIDRSSNTPSSAKSFTFYASQLFVHRIPNTVNEEHLTNLFLAHADIKPLSVETIEFQGNMGKTHVVFRSPEHATLAFQYLEGGKPEPDPSGRLQKKVFLRNKSYIRVRKMAFEKTEKAEKSDDENDVDNGNEKTKITRRASSG